MTRWNTVLLSAVSLVTFAPVGQTQAQYPAPPYDGDDGEGVVEPFIVTRTRSLPFPGHSAMVIGEGAAGRSDMVCAAFTPQTGRSGAEAETPATHQSRPRTSRYYSGQVRLVAVGALPERLSILGPRSS